ncbi:MAG: glycosyltransferase [Aerococcaceae bacterium]|nr:glycosyltransferase [Aerococcaceae bacterium]
MNQKTVCWNAIVKNESAIIERCMQAMVGHIDYWVVVDTGSTDGTQDIITNFMSQHGIPGELIERPWKNFSHNRSEALEFAENKADYILLCDADMMLNATNPDWKNFLGDAKAYAVMQRTPHLTYSNIRLINGRLTGDDRYRYWGATHEYCDSIEPSQYNAPLFNEIEMLDLGDGGSKADKFERDACLLTEQLQELEELANASEAEKALAWQNGILRHKDTLVPRCTFYLAQTWRDLDRNELAIEYYQKRAALPGWVEETWYSLYQVALLKERIQAPFDEVVAAYLHAYEYRPQRAESLYNLARYLRENNRFALAYAYALTAVSIKETSDRLFVHQDVYDYKAKDELAVSAYWVGQYQLSKDICAEILNDARLVLPEHTRQRIANNQQAAQSKLNA